MPYTYFYNAQIRKYVSQFLRIFAGFQTQDGVDRNNDGTNDFRTVNVVYGDIDRVMASVIQNQSESFVSQKIPLISGVLTSVQLAPERRMNKHHVESIAYTKTSDGSVNTLQRLIGTPVNLNFDLYLYASNTDQLFQLFEPILLLFNPHLDIQRSSDIIDWSYLTKVELTNINNQQNFPIGQQRRVIVWGLSFTAEAWINFGDIDTPDGVINQIITNIKDETNSITGVDMDSITVTDTTKEGP